ncbi:CapA family protein [Psychrobacter sanguinis]|uniref:CapA family protein n=1 Tax=Psychrobacter sanguinis TaxID=861445 RepID=UPI00191B0BAE|nr:CapA family protein [Psychrobacter sanguinis]UEC26064.1 CapA family protein [Psychrobacter sanguinis]
MKIALLGDIGFFGKFSNTNSSLEGYFDSYLRAISDCDYIVGNLEIPFTDIFKEYKPKSAVIGSSSKSAALLSQLKLTHVNLANNHIGDFGLEGYSLTKKILEKNDIHYFGIEGIKSYVHHDNNRICLSGFCNMNANPVFLHNIDNKLYGVNVADADIIEKELLETDTLGYLNIIAFHSGLEHIHLPSIEDISFFRYLANKIDFVLYGHHPHVVQSFEKHKKSHLYYSLGNFCFDDVYSRKNKGTPLVRMSEANKLGLIPILTIENNKVIDIEHIWTYMGDENMLILKEDGHPLINKITSELSLANLDFNDIDAIRKSDLMKISLQRKKSRNLQWYRDRLNLRYVKLYLQSKENYKLYKSKYLDKLNKKLDDV